MHRYLEHDRSGFPKDRNKRRHPSGDNGIYRHVLLRHAAFLEIYPSQQILEIGDTIAEH